MDDLQIIKDDIAKLQKDVEEIKKLVQEVHAFQTGNLFKLNEKRKLTPTQNKKRVEAEEKLYLQSLRNNAHRKIINGW